MQVLDYVFGIPIIIFLAIVILRQTACWKQCCKHLPCSVRVHKIDGLYEDDFRMNTYSPSTKDPYRFNVDVSIDGFITKYHGRF
jgi:hypothetical protein